MISRLRLPVFAALWLCSVAGCVIFGGTTNILSGFLYPSHFSQFFNSSSVTDRYFGVAVAQGMREGFWFGIFLASIFSFWAFWTTRAKCPFLLGLKGIATAISINFLFWLSGGVTTVVARWLLPQSVGIYLELSEIAWVFGSIWGAYIGSLPATVFACYKLHKSWQAQK